MRLAAALTLLLAAPAAAQDFIPARGLLSDEEFHKIVSCGAPIYGRCAIEPRAWPRDVALDVSVSRLQDVEPVSPAVSAQVDLAIDQAIAQINGVGARLQLYRLPDNRPARVHISVRKPRSLTILTGEKHHRDLPGGMVVFGMSAAGGIERVNIFINSEAGLSDIRSILLEELTQGMGLPFDISDPDYRRRSIFSQETNAVTVLTGQDAAVLRLHYPPTD